MRRQASGRQATPLKTTAVRLVPPPWEHSSPGTRNITLGQLLHFRVRHRDQPLGPPRRPHQAEGPAVEDTDETDGTVADSPRLGARAGERRPVAQQRPDPGHYHRSGDRSRAHGACTRRSGDAGGDRVRGRHRVLHHRPDALAAVFRLGRRGERPAIPRRAPTWGAASIPVVGVGDLLLFGTFYLGLSQQGVRPWASVTILTSGLLVALAVGIARGGAFGIPFMAVGVVLLVAASHRRASSELCPG